MKYELAIIGGGPAGYTAAEKAGEAGLPTVLFEKKSLGGVCLNEGCIPTKTLLYSAKVYDTIRGASKYGIRAENACYDLPGIIARKNKVVRKLVAGIRMKMTAKGVSLVQGEAVVRGRTAEGSLCIDCAGAIYEARQLIVCTGSEPFIPPIPGLGETAYWTSCEALEANERPASLVVIGGGVIGMEFASFFNSLGTEVHIIEMLDEILPGMDRELATLLRTEYTRRGIRFYTGHRVKEVSDQGVSVEKEGKTFRIQAEKVLLSTGRRPLTQGFGLETLGPGFLRHGIQVNEYMQSPAPGVYACGDVTGFSLLAHTAVSEAETAVRHILGKATAGMSYRAIPGIVYTNPEIAGVGATEEQLQAESRPYTVHKIPMTFSGRFVAENEMGNGICKLITAGDGTLLGAHLLGNPSSELITIAGIAIEKGLKAGELASFVFPHPTVGEILKEAAARGGGS
ncbi:MAG: dihydrolipoyl dehydrogenase [Tannerellaceae bacterium]|nr:dihydrolipoyl dehydrogenase [Tannerellaceae bacterium]